MTAIDGDPVQASEDLTAAVDAHEPGDQVRLSVTRGGDAKTITVKLGTRPAQAAAQQQQMPQLVP